MSIQAKLIAWLLSVAVVFGLLLAAYEYGRGVEKTLQENKALKLQVQQDEEKTRMATENDQLKTQLGVQHAQDTAATDHIRDDFSNFRLHMSSTCNSLPNPASGSANGVAGAGIRPNTEQEAFDAFTDGLKYDNYQTDKVMDSCRVVMNWARDLCKLNNTCTETK